MKRRMIVEDNLNRYTKEIKLFTVLSKTILKSLQINVAVYSVLINIILFWN